MRGENAREVVEVFGAVLLDRLEEEVAEVGVGVVLDSAARTLDRGAIAM